jgi:hypothetical protein
MRPEGIGIREQVRTTTHGQVTDKGLEIISIELNDAWNEGIGSTEAPTTLHTTGYSLPSLSINSLEGFQYWFFPVSQGSLPWFQFLKHPTNTNQAQGFLDDSQGKG